MKGQAAAMMLGLGICVSAQAALWTFNSVKDPSLPGMVPDNNPIGFTDAQVISGENSFISSVEFTLTVSGGYDLDLAGYLRLGNTGSSPYYAINLGSPTYSDGENNVYVYPLTSPFYNLDPNDTWTLFLADQSPGGEDSVVSWSLDITSVPEPVDMALVMLAGLAGLWWCLRACWTRTTAKAEEQKKGQ